MRQKERITLISFAVYRIPNAAKALVKAANRGVQLTVIVETPDQIEGEGEYSIIKALGQEVAACSSVYFWPKYKRQASEGGKPGILHVKCAVADGEWLFLSSANLARQAFTVNMELGMLVRGGTMPKRVEEQFRRLLATGVLLKVRGHDGVIQRRATSSQSGSVGRCPVPNGGGNNFGRTVKCPHLQQRLVPTLSTSQLGLCVYDIMREQYRFE